MSAKRRLDRLEKMVEKDGLACTCSIVPISHLETSEEMKEVSNERRQGPCGPCCKNGGRIQFIVVRIPKHGDDRDGGNP
jgi:hypothetical protein